MLNVYQEKYLDHEQRDPFASQHDVDEDGNEVRIVLRVTLLTNPDLFDSN